MQLNIITDGKKICYIEKQLGVQYEFYLQDPIFVGNIGFLGL